MRKSHILLLTILFSQICISGFSQTTSLKIAAQYRLRSEYRHGYKTLSPDSVAAAFFLAQRARLGIEFKTQKLTSYISIQDSRTWGDEEQLKDLPGLSVNELWVELPISKHLSLKTGRQELVYDDQRLLGNLDWGNATRSHDALLLKYNDSVHKFSFHAGGAFNQSGEPLFGTSYTIKNYKYLQFAWMKKEFGNHSISFTEILNGPNTLVPDSKKTKSTVTFGPLYNFKNHHLKVTAGGYYQTGNNEINQSVSSYMLNLYTEITFRKFFAGVGFDQLSGNNYKTPSTESHSFSTLYATNHKFYGGMDYFINIPADTKQLGLTDPYLRIGFQQKKMKATVDIHHFSTQHNPAFGSNKNKTLGDEVDMLLDYAFNPLINLQAGYSKMFATTNMEKIKGGNKNNNNNWMYLMLKVSPSYLFTK